MMISWHVACPPSTLLEHNMPPRPASSAVVMLTMNTWHVRPASLAPERSIRRSSSGGVAWLGLVCHSLAFVYKVWHGSRRDASSLSKKRGLVNETKTRACCDEIISNFVKSFNLVPPKVTSGTSAKARATRRDWACFG